MAQLTFFIDYNDGAGYVQSAPPKNHSETRLQLVWSNGVPSASIKSIDYTWVGTEAQKLYAYRTRGLTTGNGGGPGVLEGPGLKVMLGTKQIFEGCIDIAQRGALWECDKVQCPIRENKIDWLNETAASFTFSHLRRIGMITSADYKKTPYHLTTIPDGPLLATLTLTELVAISQIRAHMINIINLVTHAGGEATGTATVVGAPAAAPMLAASIIEVALEAAELLFLIISVISTGQQIIDQVVQVKKYKYCMTAEDLFLKGLQYISSQGTPVGFASTILRQGTYKNTTVMPSKRIMPKSGQALLSLFERDANEVNSPKAYGYFDGTFKQFIDAMCHVFNAEIAFKSVNGNNTLHFEEKHSWNNPSNYVIPNQGVEGYTFNYPDPHGLNISELCSTYELIFQIDGSDLNTIRQYKGTSMEVCMQPIIIKNHKNLLLRGLTNVQLPFALAKRKEYLTATEQFLDKVINSVNTLLNLVISAVNGVLNIINQIIGWFGGSTTTLGNVPYLPTNVFAGRIGWMELSDDTFQIPKIFIGSNVGGDWQIHANNENDMSAEALMANFHGKNLATRGNQYLLYGHNQPIKVKFCVDEFMLIQNNNNFLTSDGKKGKFDSVEWEVEKDVAHVKFRVNEDYTKNLKETITIDGN